VSINISNFTYNQLLNNINIFNDKNINKTRNILSRRIYHLVLSWKDNSNQLITDLYTLSKYIPAIDIENKVKNQEIINALKNLNDNKIVNINYNDRNNIIFNFEVGA
jgi:hypothetical protein